MRHVKPPSHGLVALGVVIVCSPLLAGAAGSVWFAKEMVGPLVTLLAWLALFIYNIVRSRGGIGFIEPIAVIGSLVVLQLLLDLHTPHLGDVVIAALHALVIAIALLRKRRTRPEGAPSADEIEDA